MKPSKNWKRLLSLFLALAMALGVDMPATVRAAEESAVIDEAKGTELPEVSAEPDVSENETVEPDEAADEAVALHVSASEVPAIALGEEVTMTDDMPWRKFTAEHRGVYSFHADEIVTDNDDRITMYLWLYRDPEDSSFKDKYTYGEDISVLCFMETGETIYIKKPSLSYENPKEIKAKVSVTEETYGTALTAGEDMVLTQEQMRTEKWIPFHAAADGVYRFKVSTQTNASTTDYSYRLLDKGGEELKKYIYDDVDPRDSVGTEINYYRLSAGDTLYVEISEVPRDVTVSVMKLTEAELQFSALPADEGLEVTVGSSECLVKFTAPETANYRFKSGSPMTLYENMNEDALKTADETKGTLADKYVLDYGIAKDKTVYLVLTESCTLTVKQVTANEVTAGEATVVDGADGQFQWFTFKAPEKGFYDLRYSVPSTSKGFYLYETMDSPEPIAGRTVYQDYDFEYIMELDKDEARYFYVNTLGDANSTSTITVTKRVQSAVKNQDADYTFICGDRRLDVTFDAGFRSIGATMKLFDAEGNKLSNLSGSYRVVLSFREKNSGGEWTASDSTYLFLSSSSNVYNHYTREGRVYKLKAGTQYEVKVRLEESMSSNYCGIAEFVSDSSVTLEMATRNSEEDYILEVEDCGCIARVHSAVMPEDKKNYYVQWRVAGGKWQNESQWTNNLGTNGEAWGYVNLMPDTDYEFRLTDEPSDDKELNVYVTLPVIHTGGYPIKVDVSVKDESITSTQAGLQVRLYDYEGYFPSGWTRFDVQIPYADAVGEERNAGGWASLNSGETEVTVNPEWTEMRNLEAGKTYEAPVRIAYQPSGGAIHYITLDQKVTFTTKPSPLADRLECSVEQGDTGRELNYTINLKDKENFADDYEVTAKVYCRQEGETSDSEYANVILNKDNGYAASGVIDAYSNGLFEGTQYEVFIVADGVVFRKEIKTKDGNVVPKVELVETYGFGAKIKASVTGSASGTYKVTVKYDGSYTMNMTEVGDYGALWEGKLTDENHHTAEWLVYNSEMTDGYIIRPGKTHRVKVEIADDGNVICRQWLTLDPPNIRLDIKTTEVLDTEATIAMKVAEPDAIFTGTHYCAPVYVYYREKSDNARWNFAANKSGDSGVDESYGEYSSQKNGVVTLTGLKPETTYEVLVTSNQWENTVSKEYTTYGTFEFTTAKEGSGGDPDPGPGPEPDPIFYLVTFDRNGHGGTAASQSVREGYKVPKPKDPTAKGFIFGGWYRDQECTRAWNFATDTVNEPITLYAKWTEDPNGDQTVVTESPEDEEDDYYDDYYTTADGDDTKVVRIDLAASALGTTITGVKGKTYDGKAYQPAVKVTVTLTVNNKPKKVTLTEGVDYRVLYENNIHAGTGCVVIKGSGAYKGEKRQEFTIQKKPVGKLKMIVGSMGLSASGASAFDIPLKIYDGGLLLEEGVDYELTGLDGFGTKAGKYTVTVTAAQDSDYTGSKAVKITVSETTENTLTEDDVTLTFGGVDLSDAAVAGVPYTGSAIKPTVTVTHNGKELSSKEFSVKYTNNKEAGTAYVTVTGKKPYSGSVVKTFEITPAEKTFKLKSEVKDVTYNGKLQKPKVAITVDTAAANGKTKTVTLKAGKDYLIYYSNNLHATKGDGISRGRAKITVKGIGNYADCETQVFEFDILPQQMKKASVKGAQGSLDINYAKKPLVEGIDYTVSYGTPDAKGKVDVTLKGKGDFTGEVTKKVKAGTPQ